MADKTDEPNPRGKTGFKPGSKGAALKTADILVWLYRNRPEEFTIRDIMQQFGLARGEAQRRVNYMRFIWNAVRSAGLIGAHRRGRKEVRFCITKWGATYSARIVKKGKNRESGGRVAANPRDGDAD